jgi:hypothetical protein
MIPRRTACIHVGMKKQTPTKTNFIAPQGVGVPRKQTSRNKAAEKSDVRFQAQSLPLLLVREGRGRGRCQHHTETELVINEVINTILGIQHSTMPSTHTQPDSFNSLHAQHDSSYDKQIHVQICSRGHSVCDAIGSRCGVLFQLEICPRLMHALDRPVRIKVCVCVDGWGEVGGSKQHS